LNLVEVESNLVESVSAAMVSIPTFHKNDLNLENVELPLLQNWSIYL